MSSFTPLANTTAEKVVDEGLQQMDLPGSWTAATAKCCLDPTCHFAKRDTVVDRPIPDRGSSCQG